MSANDKAALREWAKERRAGLDIAALSADLTAGISALPEFRAARTVLIYLAMPGEVNIEGLMSEDDVGGRRFLVPRCAPKRRLAIHPYVPGETPLTRGPFGIREPDAARVEEADASSIDMVIVPALLLSKRGERLGYGGGYYDRFLPTLGPGCVRVGALPNALVVPSLPQEPWDATLDIVVTETLNLYREPTWPVPAQ